MGKNPGYVSLSEASAKLQRAKMTLIDASRRLGLTWTHRGDHVQRAYLSLEDFEILKGWCVAHPTRHPMPRGAVNTEFKFVSRDELDKRIRAASRYKQRTCGCEVWEEIIQTELAAMSQ